MEEKDKIYTFPTGCNNACFADLIDKTAKEFDEWLESLTLEEKVSYFMKSLDALETRQQVGDKELDVDKIC